MRSSQTADLTEDAGDLTCSQVHVRLAASCGISPEATDPTVVYVETLAGGIYLEKRSDVNRYTLAFDRLRAAALHPDDSVHLIEQVASSLT